MWLANLLAAIAEQSVHEYKVKPWQIPVQGVYKIIAAAQGHFTRAMVGNWIPPGLWSGSSANLYVLSWLGVGFLLLGCGIEVYVGFLGFLSKPDPEDPRQKYCVDPGERQMVSALAVEHSNPLLAALWLAFQNCYFPYHWLVLCCVLDCGDWCNSRQPIGIWSVNFKIAIETASSKQATTKWRVSQTQAVCILTRKD